VDETEALLKFNETKIKQLQENVRDLKEEKSGLETKLQIEKDKSSQYKDMLDDERSKVKSYIVVANCFEGKQYRISQSSQPLNYLNFTPKLILL